MRKTDQPDEPKRKGGMLCLDLDEPEPEWMHLLPGWSDHTVLANVYGTRADMARAYLEQGHAEWSRLCLQGIVCTSRAEWYRTCWMEHKLWCLSLKYRPVFICCADRILSWGPGHLVVAVPDRADKLTSNQFWRAFKRAQRNAPRLNFLDPRPHDDSE